MNSFVTNKVSARRQQHEDSFTSIYNQYVERVYQHCLLVTKNSLQAKDFTHDIFLKVHANLKSFGERSSFSTWLWAITNNYCLDQLRLSKRLNVTTLSCELEQQLSESNESVLQEERYQLVLNHAFKALSSQERRILLLKYEEGMSLEEIALLFNISISAVKMRLKRSREKVYQFCQQAG